MGVYFALTGIRGFAVSGDHQSFTARFAGVQHNRGDHQSFADRFAGMQHNHGDHQSVADRFSGIPYSRGDHQSFACLHQGLVCSELALPHSFVQQSVLSQWLTSGPSGLPVAYQWLTQWLTSFFICFLIKVA